MTKGFCKMGIWATGAALGLALGMSSVQAQDTVTLRFEHFLPANSNAHKDVIEPWCEDINEASDGRIECEIYPSMQLGGEPSQLADLVRSGVVDVVWTALGYSPGRFPRSEALELPFMLPAGGETASRIVWDFAQSYAKEDFKDYKVLAVYSDGGGTIHTTDKAVHDLDDMKGLRIRASTRMASKLLQSLNATPVSMPPSQIADTLSKGVIDGALAVWEVVPPTKLDETTFHHTEVSDYEPEGEPQRATTTVTTLAVLMNQQTYNNMPEDLQDIIDEYSGKTLSVRFGKSWDRAIHTVKEDMANDPDQDVILVDDATYEAMVEASQGLIDEWVASDEGGFDHQAVFDGLQEIVDEYTPALVR